MFNHYITRIYVYTYERKKGRKTGEGEKERETLLVKLLLRDTQGRRAAGCRQRHKNSLSTLRAAH